MSTEGKKEELESTKTKTEEEKLIDNDDSGDDEIALKGVEKDNKEGKSFPIKKRYCVLSTFVMTSDYKENVTTKMIAKDKTKKNYNVCERIDDPTVKEIEVCKVNSETLESIVKYLNEHKGKEPPPLPCPVRSTEMSEIVSVKWDAEFIDAFDKKRFLKLFW
ncbi:hypothetical protein RFI_27535 [Reticulomyxa filosa]|uniref:SKP1 component POZ domain-containing protein n=1 Tax=Reticulomyxa filosa TaxID=46433 RepID=X6M8P2_RETFI|nr:hypothetical protein RFI_27535 [Reticulomyxa filosa]|eukprot:ETO09842.1 hypothetical protein RFI_27535 [Reticulomyxa filosa]